MKINLDDAQSFTEAARLWDEFSDNIKYKNRFFVEQNILDILDRIIKYSKVSPFGELELLRARLGDFVDKEDKEVQSPPKGSSNDGRGNPKGISYFYTATKKGTAIAEIRPYTGASVTVAKFRTTKPFSLIDFRAISVHESSSYAPLPLSTIDRCFLKIILEKLSTPVLDGNTIEYIPLQYIIEYLKTKNFEGIIYKSAVGDGANILFFNEDGLELIEKKLCKITKVEYTIEELDK